MNLGLAISIVANHTAQLFARIWNYCIEKFDSTPLIWNDN